MTDAIAPCILGDPFPAWSRKSPSQGAVASEGIHSLGTAASHLISLSLWPLESSVGLIFPPEEISSHVTGSLTLAGLLSRSTMACLLILKVSAWPWENNFHQIHVRYISPLFDQKLTTKLIHEYAVTDLRRNQMYIYWLCEMHKHTFT